jgi:hypothetical protein
VSSLLLLLLSLLTYQVSKLQLQRSLPLLSQRLKRLRRHASGSDPVAEEQFDDLWANWMAVEGLDIEDEIHQTLLASKGLLDMDDGTHAQWVGGTLGVLLTFDFEEVDSILNAWDEAQDGNLIALSTLIHWLQGFTVFLQACTGNIEEP